MKTVLLLLSILVFVSGVTVAIASMQPKAQAQPQEPIVGETIRVPTKDEILANAQLGHRRAGDS
jgi:hypothetical protein